MTEAPSTQRVAVVSLHTSPLLRPGTGDAGGMNVYVAETTERMARRGLQVDVLTRATADAPPGQLLTPAGATVHHLAAGPPDAAKEALPEHVEEFTAAARGLLGGLDVVHSHYWLSGLVGLGLDAPLVHTMHTMARVKNGALAPGDAPEPPVREAGEARVVAGAAALVANTPEEAGALTGLYAATPDRVHVALPGVATETFRPGDRFADRRALGLAEDDVVLLQVGRVQPLKGQDLLVRAAAELLARDPSLRGRLVVQLLGGLSGAGVARRGELEQLVDGLGLGDVVRTGPPVPRERLAAWYRAADLVAVPSRHESFGLVAVEALACGTPVVAARVGGLPLAVGDAGVLVDGHEPGEWADALATTLGRLADPAARAAWSHRAVEHAAQFSWERTVDALLAVYREVGR